MGIALFYATDFQVLFLGWRWVVLLGFSRGFWEKRVFWCGVLMVNLWWNAWLLWTEDTTLRGA
jgi:hypothetical protein